MRRARLFVVVALFSFLSIACCSMMRDVCKPHEAVVAVRPDPSTGQITVYPYRATVYGGATVEWFAGELTITRIEWRTPLNFKGMPQRWPTLTDPVCSGGKCTLRIPDSVNYGRYPYYLHYRTPAGMTGRVNQPELDIRG